MGNETSSSGGSSSSAYPGHGASTAYPGRQGPGGANNPYANGNVATTSRPPPPGRPIGGGPGPGGAGGRQRKQRPPGLHRVPGTRGYIVLPDTAGSTVEVVVPAGVRPQQQFQISVDRNAYWVTCPPNARPGQTIQVQIPGLTQHKHFKVRIPPRVRSGGSFQATIEGHRVPVTVPMGYGPGDELMLRVDMSKLRNNNATAPNANGAPGGGVRMQTYEVEVPRGVLPGQPFKIKAGSQPLMIKCPLDARPGMKVRFQIPESMGAGGAGGGGGLHGIRMEYDKDGWCRCLDPTTLKFKWALAHDDSSPNSATAAAGSGANGGNGLGGTNGNIIGEKYRLHPEVDLDAMAIVRKLPTRPAEKLVCVPAGDYLMDTGVPRTNITYAELQRAQSLPFNQKVDWFRRVVSSLKAPWDFGHVTTVVRRSHLLDDAMQAFNALSPAEFRQSFRYEFFQEAGIDAGGIAREFYQICSEQLFNPVFGLFQYSSVNQMCMQLASGSGVANDQHLEFFKFAGRLLGKALFDGQLVKAHLVRPLYKHLLAWPVTLKDLEHVDVAAYNSLISLLETCDDVEVLCLDFTISEEVLGQKQTIELKEGGENIPLTNDNFREYIDLQVQYRLLVMIRDQLTAFIQGFLDVVPEPLLSVFDFQELELLSCGLPNINIADWKEHTQYQGEYQGKGANHQVVKWFWEVLEHDFNEEQKARLLQFVTGTSGVPPQGFKVLQGNDANIRLFTITSMPVSISTLPRAHTCFNRIDLPLYKTKEELRNNVRMAIMMEITGFSIE